MYGNHILQAVSLYRQNLKEKAHKASVPCDARDEERKENNRISMVKGSNRKDDPGPVMKAPPSPRASKVVKSASAASVPKVKVKGESHYTMPNVKEERMGNSLLSMAKRRTGDPGPVLKAPPSPRALKGALKVVKSASVPGSHYKVPHGESSHATKNSKGSSSARQAATTKKQRPWRTASYGNFLWVPKHTLRMNRIDRFRIDTWSSEAIHQLKGTHTC